MKRVTRNGKTLNKRTLDMLERAEARYGGSFYVVQGSYNAGGVSASAGTHDGGGAVDLSVSGLNIADAVKALREVGFAAWYRAPLAGVWNAHIHAIAIGDADLASGARSQVAAYYAGRDGLAGNRADSSWRPESIPVWPIKLETVAVPVIKRQMRAKKPKSKAAVKQFQRVLNRRLNINLLVDGVAGQQTRNAWKKYQSKIGAKPDGVVRWGGAKRLFAGFYKPVLVGFKKK